MTMAKPRSSGVDRVKLRHAVDSGIAMVALALTGLLAGAVAWVLGWQSAGDLAWAITTAIAVPPAAISLLQRLRHGSPRTPAPPASRLARRRSDCVTCSCRSARLSPVRGGSADLPDVRDWPGARSLRRGGGGAGGGAP